MRRHCYFLGRYCLIVLDTGRITVGGVISVSLVETTAFWLYVAGTIKCTSDKCRGTSPRFAEKCSQLCFAINNIFNNRSNAMHSSASGYTIKLELIIYEGNRVTYFDMIAYSLAFLIFTILQRTAHAVQVG